MAYGEQLLSKICDENAVHVIRKYGIERDHFATDPEQRAFDFIVKYAEENGGDAPSYAVLVSEVPDIEYIPDVSDSFEYLARKLKNSAGKRRIAEFIEKDLARLYHSLDTDDLISQLTKELENIKMRTRVRIKVGRYADEIAKSMKEEYERRAAGKSFKLWKTPFPSLDKEIGGFFSGDVYGIMAESGRGKTYLTCAIVDSLLRQGATVLVKSFEVKEYLWMSRLMSVATAVDELLYDEERGIPLGMPNRAILSGKLDDYIRDHFFDLLDRLETYYPGRLILQAKSSPELTRTLDDLDRELHAEDIDVVVVDPFYGFADVYAGRNTNRTTGGAAEYAATRFEQIVGEHDVVGIYTVQATVDKKNREDDGDREIRIPTRDQVKTSKRLLDIATNLIGFDSVEKEGIAAIGLEKGRNGGEDFRLDLLALFDYGVIREFPKDQELIEKF